MQFTIALCCLLCGLTPSLLLLCTYTNEKGRAIRESEFIDLDSGSFWRVPNCAYFLE